MLDAGCGIRVGFVERLAFEHAYSTVRLPSPSIRSRVRAEISQEYRRRPDVYLIRFT